MNLAPGELIFLFFLFSFIGWLFELFLELLAGRGFVNRGFFYGPIVPIYAVGFFFSYTLCAPLKNSPLLVFVVSCAGCTLMEAIIGRFLEKILRVRAWDYDIHPLTFWCNYKGRLSLMATLSFGALSLLSIYCLWDLLFQLINILGTKNLRIIDGVLLAVFACDAFFSLKKYIRNKRAGIVSTTKGMEHNYDIIELFNTLSLDILCNSVFRRSKNYIQHGATSIYEHSIEVAKTSLKFSLFWPVSSRQALVRAALLHDFFLYDWHDEWKLDHGFTHPAAAAENAKKYFNISEKEYSLIRTHMWPLTLLHPPKYKEGWIICLSDKIVSLKETLNMNKLCSPPPPPVIEKAGNRGACYAF
ncbi:MAG: hypothetical protein LBG76_01425 [Treponema sp.]|nr:hypothetical protein [Treponema sp.]